MQVFDYHVLIPYKVDFSTSSVGKYIKQSKRKCTWKFGFAHIPSIESGKSDVECRGKEMELTLIWSVTSGRHELYLNNKLIHVDPSHGHLVVEKQFEHTFYVSEAVLKGSHIIKVAAYALGIGSHSGGNQFSMSFDGQEYNNFCPMYDLGSESMKAKYSSLFQKEPTHSDIPLAIAAEIVPVGNSGNPFESLAVPMTFALPVSSDLTHSVSNDQDELRLIEEAKLKSIQDHELHQQRSDLYPKNSIHEQQLVAQAKIHSFRYMHQTLSTPTSPIRSQLPANDQNDLLHFQGSEVPNLLYSPISSENSEASHEMNFAYPSIDYVPSSSDRNVNNSNALVASAQYTGYEIPPDEPDLLSRRLKSDRNKFLSRW
jgi:hypothetical protein